MIRCTTPRFPTADHELAEVRSLRPMARRQRVTPRPALAVLGAALAAALVVSAPTTVANPTDIQDEGWGAWTGLSQGMVGRRRVPPKFDQPAEERRQDTTALRHADARRQLQRLRSAQNKPAAKQSSALRGSVQRGKGKGKQRGKGASWKNTLADESTQELTTVETTPELTMVEPTPELSTMVATLEATVLQAEATAVVPPNAAWLRTDAAGLYAVSVADLAAGLDESADTVRAQASAGTLSLTTAGRPRSWYFDATADELLFAGEAYKTFYTDENAHHLSLDAADAQPMAIAAGAPTAAAEAPQTFRDTLHFEKEPDMFYSTWTVASEPDADYWFWDYLYGGYKDQIQVTLSIPSPSPDGTAQVRVRLRGWTDLEAGDEHRVYAELNGASVGTILIWDGFQEAVLVADVDQALLNAGGDNTLTLRNDYDLGTHPGQWLDDVEVDYDRLPVADGGALWLDDVAAGVQTVTNFASSEILVIESPTGNAVLRQDARIESDGAGGWQATFDVPTATDYLVVQRASIAAPVVAPDYPVSPRLASTENAADYLIITAPEFVGTADALADYRTTDFGVVKVVTVDDIYDEFSFGREDPTAITRFMEQVGQWSSAPSVVVLIGKGSLDHKDRMGYGDSFLPILMTTTPWALFASDDRLLGVNGDASFAIGRLPLTDDAEGVAYVQKLSNYEAMGLAGHRRAVVVADNPDEAGDFHANSDLLAEQLWGLGFSEVAKLYHPDDAVSSALADSATWDAEYVSYDGHGSSTQIGDGTERFVTVNSAAALANPVQPIFTALTCSAGNNIAPGIRSVADALVLNPTGGAVAAMVPTGSSLDADAQTLGSAFVDYLFLNGDSVGDAVRAAKADTAGQIAGFVARIYTIVGEPGVRGR